MGPFQGGRLVAFLVGIGSIGAGFVAGMNGSGPVVATILVLVGGSALSGWARKPR